MPARPAPPAGRCGRCRTSTATVRPFPRAPRWAGAVRRGRARNHGGPGRGEIPGHGPGESASRRRRRGCPRWPRSARHRPPPAGPARRGRAADRRCESAGRGSPRRPNPRCGRREWRHGAAHPRPGAVLSRCEAPYAPRRRAHPRGLRGRRGRPGAGRGRRGSWPPEGQGQEGASVSRSSAAEALPSGAAERGLIVCPRQSRSGGGPVWTQRCPPRHEVPFGGRLESARVACGGGRHPPCFWPATTAKISARPENAYGFGVIGPSSCLPFRQPDGRLRRGRAGWHRSRPAWTVSEARFRFERASSST